FGGVVGWIEKGLTRLEIEAIKARGVTQLLEQMQQALERAAPPDLVAVAAKTRAAWERSLAEEAGAAADVLLNTLEPFQREIEHHFHVEGHRRFHGLMALYPPLFTRAQFVGSQLGARVSFWPKVSRGEKEKAPASTWNLATFTRACSDMAATRQLDARGRALANRLLVEADVQEFPV